MKEVSIVERTRRKTPTTLLLVSTQFSSSPSFLPRRVYPLQPQDEAGTRISVSAILRTLQNAMTTRPVETPPGRFACHSFYWSTGRLRRSAIIDGAMPLWICAYPRRSWRHWTSTSNILRLSPFAPHPSMARRSSLFTQYKTEMRKRKNSNTLVQRNNVGWAGPLQCRKSSG